MGSTPISGTILKGPDDTSFIEVRLMKGGITWVNWRKVTIPTLRGHNDIFVFDEYPNLIILNDGVLEQIKELRNGTDKSRTS